MSHVIWSSVLPLCAARTPQLHPFHIPRACTCVGTAVIQLIKLRCHIWNWLAVETETGVFKVWNPFSRQASPGTIPRPYSRLRPPPQKEMWFHMCSHRYLPLSLGFMMTLEVNMLFFPSPCSPLPCTFNQYGNVYECWSWSVAPKWEGQLTPSSCMLPLKHRWSLPVPFVINSWTVALFLSMITLFRALMTESSLGSFRGLGKWAPIESGFLLIVQLSPLHAKSKRSGQRFLLPLKSWCKILNWAELTVRLTSLRC